jgi:hypothetical protein
MISTAKVMFAYLVCLALALSASWALFVGLRVLDSIV